jgi:DNA-binding SARP family transcriptional activator
MRAGDMSECDTALRLALVRARDERDRLRLRWAPLALAELLPRAFERAIEPDVGRTLVSECALRASHPSLEAWPWPVHIYTLGRFAVLVDGKPIEFGRKAPKRTLALLKAIVALGGSEVPEQRLIDALWPDQEGDAAQEALAAALYRLRRLLGRHQAILQSGGALSLDRRCCFVDAWAFESALEEATNEEAALRVYRGGFLQGDVDAQWPVSLRERLRGKFVRAVRSRGQMLETAGRLEEAVDLYERGIEADELVEPFYQGLMRAYCSLGRAAEAADAYLRLSRTLSGALGIKPSVESARLFADISAPARIRSQSIPSQT